MKLKFRETQEEILPLLDGINRFNPANIPNLESYVDMQCDENEYDLEANLTLLKLYQLNPERFNPIAVAQVLLKCLTQLPKTDILLAKCLIDQPKMDVDPVKDVLQLAEQLETCHFPVVWDTLAKKKESLPKVLGLEEAMRNFVCHVVSITYQNIEKSLLVQLLGQVNDADLTKFCAKNKWEMKPDGFVYISNQEATVKSRNIAEKIDLLSIQDILKSAV